MQNSVWHSMQIGIYHAYIIRSSVLCSAMLTLIHTLTHKCRWELLLRLWVCVCMSAEACIVQENTIQMNRMNRIEPNQTESYAVQSKSMAIIFYLSFWAHMELNFFVSIVKKSESLGKKNSILCELRNLNKNYFDRQEIAETKRKSTEFRFSLRLICVCSANRSRRPRKLKHIHTFVYMSKCEREKNEFHQSGARFDRLLISFHLTECGNDDGVWMYMCAVRVCVTIAHVRTHVIIWINWPFDSSIRIDWQRSCICHRMSITNTNLLMWYAWKRKRERVRIVVVPIRQMPNGTFMHVCMCVRRYVCFHSINGQTKWEQKSLFSIYAVHAYVVCREKECKEYRHCLGAHCIVNCYFKHRKSLLCLKGQWDWDIK